MDKFVISSEIYALRIIEIDSFVTKNNRLIFMKHNEPSIVMMLLAGLHYIKAGGLLWLVFLSTTLPTSIHFTVFECLRSQLLNI